MKQQRILVCSQPKAGTYLFAAFLRELGWKDSGLHLDVDGGHDYTGAAREEALRNPKQFAIKGDPTSLIAAIAKNTFAVCHLGPNEIKPPSDFCIFIILRDICTALPSYYRFSKQERNWSDSTGWRTALTPEEGIPLFLENFPRIEGIYNRILNWLPRATIVHFEALKGDWGENLQSLQLDCIRQAIGGEGEVLQRALECALGSETLTKSPPGTVYRPFEKLSSGFLESNEKGGYTYDAQMAKLRIRYLAAEKLPVNCPVCGSNHHKGLPEIEDRYGLPVSFGQCSRCGHVFQCQQPSQDWWNDFYEKYYWPLYGTRVAVSLADEAMASHHRYVQIFQKIKALGIEPKRILDVGTGTGGVFPAATEIFPTAITTGSDVFESENPDILRVDWQVEQYPIKVDLITSIHSLEHVRSPKELIANIRASIPVDHHFYLEVPELRAGLNDRDHFFHIAHLQYFDEEGLCDILEENGYKPIAVFRGHIEEWPWTIGILSKASEKRKVSFARRFLRGLRKRCGLRMRISYWRYKPVVKNWIRKLKRRRP
jgi:hypothetical protein